MLGLEWEVYTKETVEQINQDLEKGPIVGTDVHGYEALAKNMAELKRYIEQLQGLIKYYEALIRKQPQAK